MQIDFGKYTISPIHEKDAWPICDFMVANEVRFRDYFPETLKANLTPTLSKLFVAEKVRLFADEIEFLFTIKTKEDRSIIGLFYVKNIDATKAQAELAYCLGYQYLGQGIISKATRLMTEWAFKKLGAKTLQLIINKKNTASINVAARNKFQWKKTLPNAHEIYNGNRVDMELYELRRDEVVQKP